MSMETRAHHLIRVLVPSGNQVSRAHAIHSLSIGSRVQEAAIHAVTVSLPVNAAQAVIETGQGTSRSLHERKLSPGATATHQVIKVTDAKPALSVAVEVVTVDVATMPSTLLTTHRTRIPHHYLKMALRLGPALTQRVGRGKPRNLFSRLRHRRARATIHVRNLFLSA